MYHATHTDNVSSILKNGLIPSYGNGLMGNKDKMTYLTNSLKYINIIANDIAKWDSYAILKIDIDVKDCKLIWWRGKGYKEWTTAKTIEPRHIKIYKIIPHR